MLQEGNLAPEFETRDDQNQLIRLSDFRGNWVVLYFYPKAMTPGCTTQACGLRDDFPRFEAVKAVVIGCSPDSPARLAKFKEKENLPFILAADEDHAIAQAYQVWVQKSMYGKKYMGNERTTYLIDPQGKIAHIFSQVKPGEHSQQVLTALSALP